MNWNFKPSRTYQTSGNVATSLIFSEFSYPQISGKQGTLPRPFSFVVKFVLLLKQILLCSANGTFATRPRPFVYLSVYSWKTARVYGVLEKPLHLLEWCQLGKVLPEWGDPATSTVKLMNRQTDCVQTFFAFLSLFLDLEPLFSWFELMHCNKVVAWTNYTSVSRMPDRGVFPASCSSGRVLSWQAQNTPSIDRIKVLQPRWHCSTWDAYSHVCDVINSSHWLEMPCRAVHTSGFWWTSTAGLSAAT